MKEKFLMIFALHNDWNWIWMILKSAMTSQKFWWFLMILRDYTEEVLRKNMDMVKITSNNTRIHLAIKMQIATGYLKLNMHIFPPYSLQLAPVEWVFGIIKRITPTMKSAIMIDFSKKSGDTAIHQALRRINENLGKRIWHKFIIEWIKRLKVIKMIQYDDRDT